MRILVQKFGGTSVADLKRIQAAAAHAMQAQQEGYHVVVVVSAMAGVTNQLVEWCKQAGPEEALWQQETAWAEYDNVVASGEQVTSGLLALCLQARGVKARSLLGWQVPIVSDARHGKARIDTIDTEAILSPLKEQHIVVVPGFQGVTEAGRVSTLGRGGSDTSAVALAAALKAEQCDIYTDVDGVYTADPRVVKQARVLRKVGYEEMLEMASLGAKVLQTRSVEMAMKYHVKVRVCSSFDESPGTVLVEEKDVMERRLITGVTHSQGDAQIVLGGVPNTPGVAADVFDPLTASDINVDMIVQNVTEDGRYTDMTFTVAKEDAAGAVAALEEAKKQGKLDFSKCWVDENVAKISVVGVGMRTHAGLAQKMFRTLADKGVNILVISTSEIKVSVLIEASAMELAVRALHEAYALDTPPK